ncbi:MAG: aspartate/glutamate racemase family protein [Pseudomonadota bacterium]
MPELLVLNPNTSAPVTAALVRRAEALAPAGGVVLSATARFGARYIADEVGAAVAGHAALDAYAAHVARHGVPHAVLLACFGDPGLFALRALAPVPVLGLAEAAFDAAAAQGPFIVLTGGRAWGPMLERLRPALPGADVCLGIHTLEPGGGELAAAPDAAVAALAAAAAEAQQRWPAARTVLLGGAGLAGFASRLAAAVPRPVLDSVELALQAAWRAAARGASAAAEPAASLPRPRQAACSGVAPELAALLGPLPAPPATPFPSAVPAPAGP